MYKLVKSLYDGAIRTVTLQAGNMLYSIPFDPANTDAKEFALWLQAGNKPEPAEEGGLISDAWVAETIAKLLP